MVVPAGISSSMLFCLCKQAAAGPRLVCWSFTLAFHHRCFTPVLWSTASCISILLKEWPLWLPQVLSSSHWTWLFLSQSDNSGKWEAWPLRWMESNQYALSTPLNVGVSGHIFPSCPGFPFCSMSERSLLCHSQEPDFETNSGWIKNSCFPEICCLGVPWGNLCLSMVTPHGVLRVIKSPSRARLNMTRSNNSDHHVPPTWPLNYPWTESPSLVTLAPFLGSAVTVHSPSLRVILSSEVLISSSSESPVSPRDLGPQRTWGPWWPS